MKSSLDHLPLSKQRELDFVVETIRAGFARTMANRTMPKIRGGQLLKIILFGSYARGDWVDDPVGRYYSDYDILVVVDRDELTDVGEYWYKTEDRLLTAELSPGTHLRTPVSLIYHSLKDVNEQLELGRYFFMDIAREGIVLFEEPGHPLAEPQPLSPVDALQETQKYFTKWFESAVNHRKGANFYIQEGINLNAAFLMHQTVESLYHCFLLVRTLYSPKIHNLNKLRRMAEGMEPRMKQVWSKSSKFEKRCYELLREAYVKSRYSEHYQITAEELEWLGSRVEAMRDLVEQLCKERIEELAKAA